MSENSPTDNQVDSQAGSQSSDLPAQNQTPSADERQQDSVSSGSQESDQNQNNQPAQQTTDDDSSTSADDGLTKFAKSQGIDNLDELTDRERKLLKTAHDNQKAFRTERQTQSDELKRTTEEVNTVSDDDLSDLDDSEAREVRRDAEIAQLRAAQKTSDFFNQNPEARELETDMAKLINEEKEKRGVAAARYLASDLRRLYLLAKAERGNDSEAIAEKARREERERLRREQEGSAEGGQAQSQNRGTTKITRDWVANEYDGSPEHRKLLDEAIQRGDLY